MALNKQVIDVPFVGGLNQRITSKALTAPNLITLNNGRYRKDSTIDKTYGFTKLDTGGADQITSWNNELLRFVDDRLETYSEGDSDWYDRGPTVTYTTQLDPVAGSSSDATDIGALEHEGVQVVTWVESGSTYYAIRDATTKAIILRRTELSASIVGVPVPIAVTGKIHLFYQDNTTYLRALTIPSISPVGGRVTTTVRTDLTSNGFDITAYNDVIMLAYDIGSTTLKLNRITADLLVTTTTTIASAVTVTRPSIYYDGTNVSVSWGGYTAFLNSSLVQSGSNVLLDLYASVTLTTWQVATKIVTYHSNGTTRIQSYSGGTWTTTKTLYYTVPVSKVTDGLIVVTNYNSTYQPTYFLLDITTGTADARVYAKAAAGQAGAASSNKLTTLTTNGTTGEYVIGIGKKGRIESTGGGLFAKVVPQICTFSSNTDSAYQTTITNDNLIVSGGILKSYDGYALSEYGFSLYPEGVTCGQDNLGNSVPVGTYLLAAVYEWTDNQGVRFQSSPSNIVTQVVSGLNDTITMTVPIYPFTDKQAYNDTPISAYSVRYYCSTAGGTVLYSAGITAVAPSSYTASISITTDPALNTANEILYTSGGVIENIGAPSSTFAFLHDNRIFLVGLEDPNKVAFSKDIKPLTGAGFNEDFTFNLSPTGGRITAGASLESTAIFFKESAIYAVAGTGPNDLGQNSTYGFPQQISNSVGCRDPKSLCVTPEGVFFMSSKGIFFINRSLQVVNVGEPVQDYNEYTILSANVYPENEEVRFLTNNDKTLIYHYGLSRWSTQDSVDATDATIWNNTYVYSTTEKVLLEDTSTYLNDGSYVTTTIRTGWLRLGAVAGYQRAYRMGLVGTYYNDNNFRIKVYYNYSDIAKEDTGITASDLVNTAVYGDGAMYGDDTYYGGNAEDEVYQLRHAFQFQKCEAISIELSDSTNGNDSVGRGFSLEGLSLMLAGKGGVFRHSATRTV